MGFRGRLFRVIRVLIADDHSAVRRGVRAILLSREDVDVCGEAADGKEAITKALNLRPDLIVLDLTMPIMGGFAAAKALRQMLPEIPIIFYSMHEGEPLMQEAKLLGVRGYVSKSQISGMLLDAVEAVVVHKGTFFPDSAKGAEILV
jgi:DNA-binding NarL/FixJ family response regulator